MQADRWKQIDDLYQAALAEPPEKRAALLAQACGDDADLRAEVQSLLDQPVDSFLESGPLSGIRTLTAGIRLGNFEIVELLGSGGMGEVWRARDSRLNREVAIKVLRAGLSRDPDRIARFEREARAASALNHPNIVSVYDIGRDNGTYWIASELVRGETLRRMVQDGPVPASKVIEISAQVAAGLAVAHAAGLVHRDLKPDNIMVTRDGHLKILDFGLAKRRSAPADAAGADLTDDGLVLGTAGYMAPEQIRGGAVDHRTDLFSLGAVIHEMLSGRRAFSGGSSIEAMNAILKEAPAELPASVPVALARIVRRCLEKDPDRRFQSAADLAFALQVSPADLRADAASGRPPRLQWWPVVALLVAVAVGVWLRPLPPPHVTGMVQITADGRPKYGPPLTDGSRLFFNSHFIAGDAYQVPATGGESVVFPLPVKDALIVDISPDRSEWLLCEYTASSAPCDLWVAPVLGGSARRLGDLAAHNGAAAWSPDGQQISYAKDGELHLARSDGTPVRKLATLAGQPYFVRWSPGGDRLRLTVVIGGTQSLWEARIDGSPAYRVLPESVPSDDVCCGDWTRDGKYFVFEVNNEGTTDVWALREKSGLFHRPDRGPFRLTNGPLRTRWPSPSADGKRLFVDGYHRARNEFFRYDLKSAQFSSAFPGITGRDLEFSRDSKWVVYVSTVDGSLWRSAADGSQRVELASPLVQAWMPRWSPDGKQVAFFGSRQGKPGRIYVVARDGGALKEVSHGEAGKPGDIDPSWSPDGASIAFGCDDSVPPSQSSVHVVDLKTGSVSELPGSQGMFTPRWSPDGRFIAGLSTAGWKVVLYDVRARTQAEISNVRSVYPVWSWDGQSLFYETTGLDAAWWRVPLHDRKPERVAALKNLGVTGWFAPAPGNSLITARSGGTDEIYALNWDAP